MLKARTHVLGGVDEVGDPDAPVGSRPWCVALFRLTVRDKHDVRTKTSDLRRHLTLLKAASYWRELHDREGALFGSWEEFCQYPEPWGLGLSMRQVEAVMAGSLV